MHAVTLDDPAASRADLPTQVIPMLKGIPDFVGGHWVALSEDRGTSMCVFESEASAKALASQAESMPMANVTTQRIEVGEVMASASAAYRLARYLHGEQPVRSTGRDLPTLQSCFSIDPALSLRRDGTFAFPRARRGGPARGAAVQRTRS